jgi:multicomponent Na+:H+ antiporter subunit D
VDTGSLDAARVGLTGPGALMLLGVLVSAAALPLGAWLPDAYPEASIAATVVLSAFTTKAAVYVLARVFPGVELLVWVGVITSVVAVAYAVVEDDLRRLLGYHIVSQVGFMVAAVGVGTSDSLAGAVGHATAHIFYKGLLLMAVGAVVYATGRTRISELGGLAGALPVGAGAVPGRCRVHLGHARVQRLPGQGAVGGVGERGWLRRGGLDAEGGVGGHVPERGLQAALLHVVRP